MLNTKQLRRNVRAKNGRGMTYNFPNNHEAYGPVNTILYNFLRDIMQQFHAGVVEHQGALIYFDV